MTTKKTLTAQDVKTIDVNALEWFDKVNGNSYYAGTISVNYGMPNAQTIIMPYDYGYGDYYQQEAFKLLREAGLLPTSEWGSLSRQCRESGIILRTSKHENCKKSELKAIGQ